MLLSDLADVWTCDSGPVVRSDEVCVASGVRNSCAVTGYTISPIPGPVRASRCQPGTELLSLRS